MRKIIILGLLAGILLTCLPAKTNAAILTYDADSTGLTVSYRMFPMLKARQFVLQGQDNETVKIHMGMFSVELTLTELAPNDRPMFTMHYVIKSFYLNPYRQEGDISLPFGHGGITNMKKKYENPSDYDVKGVFQVRPFRSNYTIEFGLPNLNDTLQEQVDDDNNISQIITRDNSDQLADIQLHFRPRLLPPLVSNVEFNIEVTPQSYTLPDATFAFNGVLPVRYGKYYFWFYRD